MATPRIVGELGPEIEDTVPRRNPLSRWNWGLIGFLAASLAVWSLAITGCTYLAGA